MKPPTQYGWMAEKRSHEFLLRRVPQLEANGQAHAMPRDPKEQTAKEREPICRQLLSQGLPSPSTHNTTWEMVPERYFLLPPET